MFSLWGVRKVDSVCRWKLSRTGCGGCREHELSGTVDRDRESKVLYVCSHARLGPGLLLDTVQIQTTRLCCDCSRWDVGFKSHVENLPAPPLNHFGHPSENHTKTPAALHMDAPRSGSHALRMGLVLLERVLVCSILLKSTCHRPHIRVSLARGGFNPQSASPAASEVTATGFYALQIAS